jgi:hypothetical protein
VLVQVRASNCERQNGGHEMPDTHIFALLKQGHEFNVDGQTTATQRMTHVNQEELSHRMGCHGLQINTPVGLVWIRGHSVIFSGPDAAKTQGNKKASAKLRVTFAWHSSQMART